MLTRSRFGVGVAHAVVADVLPADVVASDDEDVGFLLFRLVSTCDFTSSESEATETAVEPKRNFLSHEATGFPPDPLASEQQTGSLLVPADSGDHGLSKFTGFQCLHGGDGL